MRTYKDVMEEREKRSGTAPYRIKETLPFTTEIKPSVSVKPATPTPAVSAPVAEMPAVLKGKDLDTNYMQSSIDKAKAGDYAGAKYDEMIHNEKNGYLGLGWENSHIFNYDDPYRGDLDRQRAAIMEREPFSYDYREDDLYKSILAQKEKEADQAYKDGYAQLSRQFDGDIPVNMLNKLQATKGEIIDQADSYIPQLEQLARSMYAEEGNKMLTDYGLTKQLADEDYARWRDNQNFIVSGLENKYARDVYDKEFEYNKSLADREYNLVKDRYDFEREQYEYNKEMQALALKYGVKDTVMQAAMNLYNSGKSSSLEEALNVAKIIESYYGI